MAHSQSNQTLKIQENIESSTIMSSVFLLSELHAEIHSHSKMIWTEIGLSRVVAKSVLTLLHEFTMNDTNLDMHMNIVPQKPYKSKRRA